MAEKRDPVTHRTPSQIKRHRAERKRDPEYRRKKKIWDDNYNADRGPDGKVPESKRTGDRAHKKPLSQGGSNAASNRTRKSASENRGHGLGKSGTRPSKKTLQIRRRLKG